MRLPWDKAGLTDHEGTGMFWGCSLHKPTLTRNLPFAWTLDTAMNQHDIGYNKLFSHARMIQDLVAGFIQEDWVLGLDFSTLEKVNPVYVTDDFRKRIDDLVWKIRWQGTDRWLLIYLILEPQSTVAALMALRNALYEMLLYQDLRQSGKVPEGQKFPPVAPIVLYNGKDRLTAAMDVSDLIELPPRNLFQR